MELEQELDMKIFELAKRSRVLIVEDDVGSEPFWRAVLERVDRDATLFWATSESEAEILIKNAELCGHGFDLVITDIFLSGSATGLDLWDKFFKTLHGKIIVISGVEHKKFLEFFRGNAVQPTYLQKPLIPFECIGAVYSALHERI